MNGVKKNFLYNILYQILILIIPLITMPYVSRKLGSDGVGTYSYTYSIVYYFMIFAMLGLNNYGNRYIAKIRDDRQKLSKGFKEIHLLQLITSFIMIILYTVFSLIIFNKYKFLLLFQSFYLISCVFDINWFFFGMEKFKLTVTRNTIIKILSLILIFIFVQSKKDVWIYTLILSCSTLISQLLLWPFIRKDVDRVKIKFSDIRKHIIPCVKLFLPVIAVTIYKVMDKTMLGMLTSINEVGYYDNAEKIINVPVAIICALGTVMLPRMSNMYAKGKEEECKKTLSDSMKLMMFLAFIMTFGIICVGKNFSIIFFGEEFEKTGSLLVILAITVLFLSWGNVIRTQYLIPKEKDKEYIISAFLGAIVNLIMNLIFIPKFQSIGACVGTVFAELSVMLYQTIAVRRELSIGTYLKNIIPFLFKALIMFGCIYPMNYLNINEYLRLGLQVSVGGFVYCILNINYILTVLKIKKNKPKEKKKTIVYDDYTELPMIFETDSFDSDNINNYLDDLDRVKMKIRFNNSVIGLIDFNKCSDEISDVILSETKVYNFEFDNKLFLRKGKYPKQIANNYELMKYIIDQDYNNLAYVDVNNIDNDNLIDIINYAFTKVYYMKIKNSEIDFDIDNIFKNSSIIKHDYFKECYSYIKKMNGRKKK